MKNETTLRQAIYDIGGPGAMSDLLAEFTRKKLRLYNWLREDTIPRKYILPIKLFDEKHRTNFGAFITPPSLKEAGIETPFSKFVGPNTAIFLEKINTKIKKLNGDINDTEKHHRLWTGAQLYQYLIRGYAPYGFKGLFSLIPELDEKMTDDIFNKPVPSDSDLIG